MYCNFFLHNLWHLCITFWSTYHQRQSSWTGSYIQADSLHSFAIFAQHRQCEHISEATICRAFMCRNHVTDWGTIITIQSCHIKTNYSHFIWSSLFPKNTKAKVWFLYYITSVAIHTPLTYVLEMLKTVYFSFLQYITPSLVTDNQHRAETFAVASAQSTKSAH